MLIDSLILVLMDKPDRDELTHRQIDVRYDLTRTALALEAHRIEKGTYPDALTDLVPGHLAALPVDHFDDQPLIYRRAGEGYVLYSVGANGLDDGGTSDDRQTGDIIFSLHQPTPE